MTNFVHTPSPASVSASSDVYQTKFQLTKRSLFIKLIVDALLINQKWLSRKLSKYFAKRYALETIILIHLGKFYINRNGAVKLLLW